MSKWQPIETAPKNGTIVLFADGLRVQSGFMKFNTLRDKWYPMLISRANGDYSGSMGFRPTSWRPLPIPLEDDQEQVA